MIADIVIDQLLYLQSRHGLILSFLAEYAPIIDFSTQPRHVILKLVMVLELFWSKEAICQP